MSLKITKAIRWPALSRVIFPEKKGNTAVNYSRGGSQSMGHAFRMFLEGESPAIINLNAIDTIFEINVETIRKANPSANFDLLKEAYAIAKEGLKDEKRHSGDPFIAHPVSVSSILLEWGIYDDVFHASAILHDIIEETKDQAYPITKRRIIE